MPQGRNPLDDIENDPVVVELRHTVKAQQLAIEAQRDIIGGIHADGDAHTRSSDHGPALRRSLDMLVPLLMGMILGALTTYATISGRMAAIETTVAAHTSILATWGERWDKIQERLDDISRRMPTKGDR